MPRQQVTIRQPPQLDARDLRPFRSYDQRRALFNRNFPQWSSDVQFEILLNKDLKLKWPSDELDYIDFGTVLISDEDIFLNNLTGQKLGNWAEYLFQNLIKRGAEPNRNTYGFSNPLVEGTGVDGTFVTDENLQWTRYGLVQGRVYELKSTSSQAVNHEFTFKKDNMKALVELDGFYIMCRSHANWDGKGNSVFEYRGVTNQLITENYPNEVQEAQIAAALAYHGWKKHDPKKALPDDISVRVRQPGEPYRMLHAGYDNRKRTRV